MVFSYVEYVKTSLEVVKNIYMDWITVKILLKGALNYIFKCVISHSWY